MFLTRVLGRSWRNTTTYIHNDVCVTVCSTSRSNHTYVCYIYRRVNNVVSIFEVCHWITALQIWHDTAFIQFKFAHSSYLVIIMKRRLSAGKHKADMILLSYRHHQEELRIHISFCLSYEWLEDNSSWEIKDLYFGLIVLLGYIYYYIKCK